MHRIAAVVGQSVGNPILPATAEKFQSETDFTEAGPAPLSFGRFYRSTWGADTSRPAGILGAGWTHTYSASLRASPALNPVTVTITSAEGYLRTFALPADASSWSSTNSADSLTWTPAAWIYRRAEDDSISQFDATTGRLLSRTERNGRITRYTYNAAGQLITVTNPFGRTLNLAYNNAGLLSSVTTPDGRAIGYAYDASARLAQVSHPDGKTRSYLYENAAFPKALTGIIDEAGVRLSTYAYDAQGRAISTERAGGVDRYQVSYPAAGTATVTDPLGISRAYTYSTTLGKLAVTGGSLPSGTGEADAAARVQDANGLIASETDFTNAANATAALSYNALDAVTQASDFKGVATTYARDAQGNATTETSADIGSRVAQYDALGLPSRIVDALGQATAIERDALGRPKLITFSDGRTTTLRYDLGSTSTGYLSEITDRSGTTTYSRDEFGRVIAKTQTLASGLTQQITYAYTAAGQLAGIGYPDGSVLAYQYL
ncbi:MULTISPECIES: DUF6531 domain-containing protein [unclassified Variovorax]|uniref:DUF6531 domain-containing protein n=1 Tax=unclassified Variovorax TaxID=663243 RepID=UPI000837C15E|nr:MULTISPECIES: DUF6531 domain-containing protein [unclassified Variovorax]